MKVVSNSAEETENIGFKLAGTLKGNEIIALYGDLGAGKTAFTRGLAGFFGLKDMVSSPTFSIVNEYIGEKIKICHFDMYRINSYEDLDSTGFFEYINNGVLIIEWSENIQNELPLDVIKIRINKCKDESKRIIEIDGAEL